MIKKASHAIKRIFAWLLAITLILVIGYVLYQAITSQYFFVTGKVLLPFPRNLI